jgi:CheY-like chemotaxis protein
MAVRARTPTVLIVDDEASIRDLFSRILVLEDYRPVGASDAEAALRLLGRGLRPDAVILDLKMPGMGGFALLLRLRADPRYARIPIAIVTGDTFIPESNVHAAAALDAEIRFKPLTMEEILALVDRLLARGASVR